MEFNGKALFLIAVKIFLRDGDKLLIVHDVWNNWELPGGRVKLHEFRKPLEEAVERKVREELGKEIQYSNLKQAGTFFRVEREEKGQTVHIFGIGFEAQYAGGDIELSADHDEMRWVDVKKFQPLKLQNNDWMRGVQDYLDKIRGEK